MEYRLKKQLSILVQLAKVDNVFTDSEKATILRIGKGYGIEESEIRLLFEDHEISDSLVPMTMFQKSNFLLDMVLVLLADKEIHEKEQSFAIQIAKKLGFKEKIIEFLIEYSSRDRDVLIEMMIPYLIDSKTEI